MTGLRFPDDELDRLADLIADRLADRLPGATPAVYSCSTLAAELGCTPRAVRAAIERGELAAVRSGGRWVIAADAVAAWATPATRPRRQRGNSSARSARDAMARLDAN